jgi:hypothetical protein
VSPFLDARWISAVARLPRRWKLGSRFHRAVISKTPALAQFRIGKEAQFSADPAPLYWLRRGKRVVGYSPFGQVLRSPATREIVMGSPHLDTFMVRRDRERALQLPDSSTSELLLTLHFAGEHASARA